MVRLLDSVRKLYLRGERKEQISAEMYAFQKSIVKGKKRKFLYN